MVSVTSPELTVILTAHNRADIVEDTLVSLAEQEWDGEWDIVLVDNDSTDATRTILERWQEEMPVPTRTLAATDGHSAAYARNVGVAASHGTNFVFVDDDDLLAPGWVAAMGEALRAHEFVASRCEYFMLNAADVAAHHTFQTERIGRHFGAPVVDGAGSGMRRALWEEVGGNDETMGFAEDTDLSLRVARTGEVTPHFCAEATCHVRLRSGVRTAWSRGTRRGESEVQLFLRHGAHFGVAPDHLPMAVGRWLRLTLGIGALRTRPGRVHWVEQVGRRVGRARGSQRARRWFP